MNIEMRSMGLPLRSAEMTPVVTPKISQITAAPTASEKETGIRSVSWGHTSTWLLKE